MANSEKIHESDALGIVFNLLQNKEDERLSKIQSLSNDDIVLLNLVIERLENKDLYQQIISSPSVINESPLFVTNMLNFASKRNTSSLVSSYFHRQLKKDLRATFESYLKFFGDQIKKNQTEFLCNVIKEPENNLINELMYDRMFSDNYGGIVPKRIITLAYSHFHNTNSSEAFFKLFHTVGTIPGREKFFLDFVNSMVLRWDVSAFEEVNKNVALGDIAPEVIFFANCVLEKTPQQLHKLLPAWSSYQSKDDLMSGLNETYRDKPLSPKISKM